MVPQSWIINCLKMYKISHEVINFIEKAMKDKIQNDISGELENYLRQNSPAETSSKE